METINLNTETSFALKKRIDHTKEMITSPGYANIEKVMLINQLVIMEALQELLSEKNKSTGEKC
jgi:hypothetical protein